MKEKDAGRLIRQDLKPVLERILKTNFPGFMRSYGEAVKGVCIREGCDTILLFGTGDPYYCSKHRPG